VCSVPIVAVFQPPITNPIEEPTIMRVTCYTANEGAICSTGIKPHYGVVAGAKEWEGKAVLLYTFDYNEGGKPVSKECVGLFTILDTGAGIDTDNDGKGDTIKNGQSLDVYVDTKEQAQEWTREYGGYLLAIIVEGEG
jgi:hypothetical protein